MPKGSDVTDKRLGSADDIGQSYAGRGDEQRGAIMLSKKDTRLVKEHGFMQKPAHRLQELPVKTITKIRMKKPHQAAFTALKGREHHTTSLYLSFFGGTCGILMKHEKAAA